MSELQNKKIIPKKIDNLFKVMINNTKMTVPSYLVKKGEESTISFVPTSKITTAPTPAPQKAGEEK